MKSTMRAACYFRPLAVAMALMMMPPDFTKFGLAQAAPTVNVPAGCRQNGGSYLIQMICSPDGRIAPDDATVAALRGFETDSIKRYLASFGLPSTDADVAAVYQYGRSDLRASLKAYLQLRLEDITASGTAQFGSPEFLAYSWFFGRLLYHEKHLYDQALADFNAWSANHCAWKPDPDLAKTYGIHYIPCVGSVLNNDAPSEQYYLAAARKNEYENLLANLKKIEPQRNAAGQVTTQGSPSGLTIFSTSSRETGILAGSLGGAAALVGGAIGLSQLPQIKSQIFLTVRGEQAIRNIGNGVTRAGGTAAAEGDAVAVQESEQLATEIGEELAEEIGVEAAETAGLSETGIGLIVAVVAILVTTAVTFAVEEAQAQNNIRADLTALTDYGKLPASLNDYYKTSEGRYKIGVVWSEATWPDAPSITPLPAPDTNTLIRIPFGQTAAGAMAGGGTFQDWYGAIWTLNTYGGFWLNKGTYTYVKAGAPTVVTSFDSLTPTIRYLDWNGNRYAASRRGNNFMIYKEDPKSTDVDCPANATTGLSNPVDASACTALVASSIQLLDGQGNKVTLTVGTAPKFPPQYIVSGLINPSFSFNNNDVARGHDVSATGYPAPLVTLDSGTPPPGLAILPKTGQASFACCNFGTPSGEFTYTPPDTPPAPGTYTFTLRATNVLGTTTQQYAVVIAPPLIPVHLEEIDPPNETYFGLPITYRFAASGPGPYHFYTNELVNTGLTLYDRGNGIAEVSGTPDFQGQTRFCPPVSQGGCNIWVSNDGTETFNYDAHHSAVGLLFFQITPPSPVITSPTTLVFPTGRTSTYVIKTEGQKTFTGISAPCGLPPFVALLDGYDGTAVLTGTIPSGAPPQSFSFHVSAHALGTALDTSCEPNMTVRIDSTLSILTDTDTKNAFAVGGAPASFTWSSNATLGVFFLDSTLPEGLTFSGDHRGNATIQGVPAKGTGGEYLIRYRATGDTANSLTPEPLRLRVGEAPNGSLPPTIYLMSGVPGSFAVDPKGYPKAGGMTVRLTQGTLPPGMTGSDVTPSNDIAGVNYVKGTPTPAAAGKDYPLNFLASNIWGVANLNTNLHIVPAGDVSHDDKVDCSDVTVVKTRIGAKAGAANYMAAADVNGDGVINILDLAFISSHLPTGMVCR